jgi:hypothetical protein
MKIPNDEKVKNVVFPARKTSTSGPDKKSGQTGNAVKGKTEEGGAAGALCSLETQD